MAKRRSPVYRPRPGRSLADRFPWIAAEWDHDANGDLKPEEMGPYAQVSVHWVCRRGHEWVATPASRSQKQVRCRKCSRIEREAAAAERRAAEEDRRRAKQRQR